MDKIIKTFGWIADDDLCICANNGVAYQRDMNVGRVEYGDDYFDKYKSYEGSQIELKLNEARCNFLIKNASGRKSVLDVGAGSGTFVKKANELGLSAKGFDINPKTVEYLKSQNLYADDISDFDVVTFWDSLEHIEDPHLVLEKIKINTVVLIAIPIFDDLKKIRESKHYRPGEHFYYFKSSAFIHWMGMQDFALIDISNHEIDAGRESIGAYCFLKL